MLPISESIPFQPRPSGKPLEWPNTAYGQSETNAPYGRSFQEDFEAQMKRMRERHPKGLAVWKEVSDGGCCAPTKWWGTSQEGPKRRDWFQHKDLQNLAHRIV